jgi:hypothetical protein
MAIVPGFTVVTMPYVVPGPVRHLVAWLTVRTGGGAKVGTEVAVRMVVGVGVEVAVGACFVKTCKV